MTSESGYFINVTVTAYDLVSLRFGITEFFFKQFVFFIAYAFGIIVIEVLNIFFKPFIFRNKNFSDTFGIIIFPWEVYPETLYFFVVLVKNIFKALFYILF